MEDDKMRLVSSERDFELNFQLVDEIDYVKLNDEVEQSVLDGEFATEESSKTLIEIVQGYANRYGVRFVR